MKTIAVPWRLASVVLTTVLSACATQPADRGAAGVHELLAARDDQLASRPTAWSADPSTLEQQLTSLLSDPLTPDRAVGIALLKNSRMRMAYAELGLAQAEWLDASRLSNPVLSMSALDSDASGEQTRLGFGLAQNFTDLLFLRSRSRIADQGRSQVQAETAAAIQALAAEVLARYYEAVSAAQIAQMRGVIARAASASATLAQRFKDAGNINALELSRERAAETRARLDHESAEVEAASAALALNEALGLMPPVTWTLDTRLPLPVEETLNVETLVASALQRRLDLVAKQREIDAIEGVLGLARTLRWIPFLEVGIEGEREGDGSRLLGPTVSIEIPLFGKGQSEVLRLQARREQAIAQAEAIRASIANGVANAVAHVHATQARIRRFQDGLVPEREAIVARMQELQNYMIVGQFELLLAKQEEYEAYAGYLEALRDYWLARVALARAAGGSLPGDDRIGTPAVEAVTLPAAPGGGHDGHHGHHEHHQMTQGAGSPADDKTSPADTGSDDVRGGAPHGAPGTRAHRPEPISRLPASQNAPVVHTHEHGDH